jgi:hypothetical protein
VITLSRVTPGRIVPPRGGVTTWSPMTKKNVHDAAFLDELALLRIQPKD